jgi:ABC-type transporter Mla MlaB component
MIESRITTEVDTLHIDLKSCSYIDSEGVIFLHQWLGNGNSLQLVKPPDILFEILDILEIKSAWNLEHIITNEV